MSDCIQLLIGLPSTGKTTFIAALWHTVTSSAMSSSLRLEKLHGDHEHLNAIRNNWLNCLPVGRTIMSAEKTVSMKLIAPDSGESMMLHLPDMSGESFNSHWKDRKWTKEYDDMVKQTTGVLLFIHPENVIVPARIDEADDIISELGEDFMDETLEKPPPVHAETVSENYSYQWDADKAPTQTKFVELLQFLRLQSNLPHVFRVAVIISAWDLVEQNISPDKWLSSRLPLLYQYLKANSESFLFKSFGISAQGGDYSSQEECKRLQKEIDQEKRIIVITQDSPVNDITTPIKWVMGL